MNPARDQPDTTPHSHHDPQDQAGADKTSAAFVWPPRTPPEDPAPEAATRAAPAPVRQWLRETERVWLGPTRLPFARERLASGWDPDPPEAYCWRCATTVGPFEADAEGCAACRARRDPWDGAIRLGAYAGPLRRAIHELKFEGRRTVGTELGRLLAEALVARLERDRRDPAGVGLVPIPTTWRRRMARRGIDHTLVLGRAVRRTTRAPLVPALRRRHGAPQTAISAGARARNVARSIHPRRGVDLGRFETLVLIDDVRTTGATLRAGARALKRLGTGAPGAQQIWIATVGVTPLHERRTRFDEPRV